MRDSGLRAALGAWIEARLYVAAAYIVVSAAIGRQDLPATAPVSDGLLAWDGRWYEDIANAGYDRSGDLAVRFWPLWPLAGRALGLLPHLDTGLGLVIAANVCALSAGVLMHRLVLDETGDELLARRSAQMLALAPPSFVLAMGYSEALYLNAALAVFIFAGGQRWWLAAAAGFLAGLTRPVGVLLALAVACIVIGRRAYRYPAALAAVAAPAAGTATFVGWVWLEFGDPTAPAAAQSQMRGDFTEPVSRLVRAVWRAGHGDEGELLHLMAAVVLALLAVVVIRRLSLQFAVYAVSSVVFFVSAENLNSLERYGLSAFPLIVAAAVVTRHRWFDGWAVRVCAVAMACLTALAFAGVYVP